MAISLHLDVVSAEEEIYSGAAEFVVVPTQEGELGILARHAPLLAHIRPGELRIKLANSKDPEIVFYVSGGLLDIQPYFVTILADTVLRGADIDEEKALETKRRAEETLKHPHGTIDTAAAQAELDIAMAKLAIVRKIKQLDR